MKELVIDDTKVPLWMKKLNIKKKTLRDATNHDTYIQWWQKDDKVEGFMTLDKSKESRSLQINDELEVQLYKKDVQWSTLAYIVDVKFKEDGSRCNC